jgi:hypothetical protein
MVQMLPPGPPPVSVATGDDDRLARVRFHLWQIMICFLTVAATVWVMLLGVPILSITAIAFAKHVLVAVLIMGLDLYPARPTEDS